jgi:hypothetical protein
MELLAHEYWGLFRYYAYHYFVPKSVPFSADEVAPSLFVGDLHSAFQRENLRDAGITHVVCMLPGLPELHSEVSYLLLPSLDDATFDLSVHFTRALRFISHAHTAGGKVLVHCSCGVSRSATIAALYEMKRLRQDAGQVLARFREKRAVVSPNPGFLLLLQNWHLSRLLALVGTQA